MKIPLDVLHIPDIPTTTSKVSLAGIKKCSYPIIHSHKVSAKYCYAAYKLRLHQNDRCKRFTLL